MEQIKDTIQTVLGNLKNKTKDGSAQEKTFKAFRKLLTRPERSHIKCIALRSNVLIVNVDSSAWLYQLSLKKSGLAAKSGLQDIRFRIGEIK
jgi:hypothetical protein